jgi:hypothetical protein
VSFKAAWQQAEANATQKSFHISVCWQNIHLFFLSASIEVFGVIVAWLGLPTYHYRRRNCIRYLYGLGRAVNL